MPGKFNLNKPRPGGKHSQDNPKNLILQRPKGRMLDMWEKLKGLYKRSIFCHPIGSENKKFKKTGGREKSQKTLRKGELRKI